MAFYEFSGITRLKLLAPVLNGLMGANVLSSANNSSNAWQLKNNRW